jgi:hypothetical protein
MTDHSNTGDTHGIVASILAEHDAHHAGTSWADSVPAPQCHVTHAHMVGGSSAKVENTLQRIINNGNLGTPEQSQFAKWWLERNRSTALSTASPLL